MKLTNRKSRRDFIKCNAMGYAGLIIGADVVNINKASFTNSNAIDENRYVSPSYFTGKDDVPKDLFGDLNLIRKGISTMTMGSGDTIIEPLNTTEEWSIKIKYLTRLYTNTLGVRPEGLECDASIRIEKEFLRNDVIERHVSYLLSPGERVTSVMLIPKKVRHPLPTILTIHPTTEYGKEQTVGRGEMINGVLTSKANNRAYGLHLAKRGYVTFSPDLLGAGERIFPGTRAFDNQPFIDAYPEWSGSGKDLWDLKRAIDVMETFSEIDVNRIGSIGHSQGAGLTLALSAMDKRIKVGVSNCGVWPSRISKNPFNGARTEWWTGRPALRPFIHLGKSIPIDSHELFALCAPRPFLNITALNDSGYDIHEESFTRASWENLELNVKKIYALYEEEDKFNCVLHLDGHDFHENYRNLAYQFIDKYL